MAQTDHPSHLHVIDIDPDRGLPIKHVESMIVRLASLINCSKGNPSDTYAVLFYVTNKLHAPLLKHDFASNI